MNNEPLFSIRLPTDPGYVSIASMAVGECARLIGFASEERYRISLAVEEGVANAVKYGFGGAKNDLDIKFGLNLEWFEIVISSKGLPLETDKLPKYDPDNDKLNEDAVGLHVFMIEKMMDRVDFEISESGGREIRMFKRLPEKYMSGISGADGSGQTAAGGGKGRIKTDHSVRIACPDDAESISRLALKAHGSVFFNENIYYPERVKSMISAGNMVSAVAVTPGGELIGHVALVAAEKGARVEEISYAFASPRHRSRGCMMNIATFLVRNAQRRGILALEVQAVTNHTHSQRVLRDAGFAEAGLFLATSPASQVWGKGGSEKPERIGNMMLVRYLGPGDDVDQYAPSWHIDVIKRIYDNIGLRPRLAAPSGETTFWPDNSEIVVDADIKEGWALLTVRRYGKDLVPRIKELFARACAKGAPVLQLQLPMNDPAVEVVCGSAEEMGFFFAGVSPSLDQGELLALQYLNAVPANYGSVHTCGAFARELKEYIRKCDPVEKRACGY